VPKKLELAIANAQEGVSNAECIGRWRRLANRGSSVGLAKRGLTREGGNPERYLDAATAGVQRAASLTLKTAVG